MAKMPNTKKSEHEAITAGDSPSKVQLGEIVRTVLTSRALDDLEEATLLPAGELAYQFSSRGHELIQAIVAQQLVHAKDAAAVYYRSRALALGLGFSVEDTLAAGLARTGPPSDGRDVQAVWNYKQEGRPTIIPSSGGVGSQFTPACGWAQAIEYYVHQLSDDSFRGAIAVVHGGDGSVATNGFWSALNIAATQKLPLLFVIEDNDFAISVPSDHQVPGGDIAKNLNSFKNLKVVRGDGSQFLQTFCSVRSVMDYVREGNGPALLSFKVPRLCGHSGQDDQAYKGDHLIAEDQLRDPLIDLKSYAVPKFMSEKDWQEANALAESQCKNALVKAKQRPAPSPSTLSKNIYPESVPKLVEDNASANLSANEIKMSSAIRRTLESEMKHSDRTLVFGEDVAAKGGVHSVTLGLQEKFGDYRVFDTSLSEEGIIGRSIGMALAGLTPLPEIQYRRYADPAKEQLHSLGTLSWRTNGRFAANVVVRIPVGFAQTADLWHSACDEVEWAHMPGWKVVFPSNAQDAVGLLRSAIRGSGPVMFLEHRHLLSAPSARTVYPGDHHTVEIGRANHVLHGDGATIITWGAMVERCRQAVDNIGISCDLIDLRSIMPWDSQLCLDSARRTRRVLVVHEDTKTAGFGAEVTSVITEQAFFSLEAPVIRVAAQDTPVPFNADLLNEAIPTVEKIQQSLDELIKM